MTKDWRKETTIPSGTAYQNEVNIIRLILGKYQNEWSNPMLCELATLLADTRVKAAAEERERVRELVDGMKKDPDVLNKTIAGREFIAGWNTALTALQDPRRGGEEILPSV